MSKKKDHPNPGSTAAIKAGCTCPVLDNNHGEGMKFGGAGKCYWISESCPLHGQKAKA